MATRTQYKVRAFLLLIPFVVVLWALFMRLPWYGTNSEGQPQTGLDYFDNLFNEVSKKSAFGPEAQQEQLKEADKLNGQAFDTTITMKGDPKVKYSGEDAAKTAATLLGAAGLQAKATSRITVESDEQALTVVKLLTGAGVQAIAKSRITVENDEKAPTAVKLLTDAGLQATAKGKTITVEFDNDKGKTAVKLLTDAGLQATAQEKTVTFEIDKVKTAVKLLTEAGLPAKAEARVKVEGDLGALAKAVITDSIAMYNNQGDVLQGKYGLGARQALFTWHQLLGSLSKSKDLAALKSLDAGGTLQATMRNVVEPAYNYYGVEVAQGRTGMMIFAIVFYLVYTVWYGFGILYLFEGLGINLGH